MNKHTITAATATGLLALFAGTLGGGLAGTGLGRATAPTPDACLTAINEGERAISLSSDALGLAAEAVEAAALWDYNELERIHSEADRIAFELGSPDDYHAAVAECRGEAR